MTVRVGIFGYGGRMGQAIAELIAANPACTLAGGVVRSLKPEQKQPEGAIMTTNAEDVIKECDVMIDVSFAEAASGHAKLMTKLGKALVVCTTGLDSSATDVLKVSAQNIPVLYAPNTSLSLAATKQIAALAAKLLGGFDYDVAILDEHHRMKKDAPSGTALALGEAVKQGNGGAKQPSYAAIRAGHIVGEHEVSFVGEGEIIRIRHSVTDRRIFARGAVQAALWLCGKPNGFYGMDDVLGI